MRLLKWRTVFRLSLISNSGWRLSSLLTPARTGRAVLAFLGQSWSTTLAQDAVVAADAAARDVAARLAGCSPLPKGSADDALEAVQAVR
jgi:hypothetical protein